MPDAEAPTRRSMRARCTFSIALSASSIVAACTLLVAEITDPAFLSAGPAGYPGPLVLLFETMAFWIVPPVIGLVTVSGLPRTDEILRRLPVVVGILALAATAAAVLYPLAAVVLSLLLIGAGVI